MGFKLGQQKTPGSGRKRGTPNRKTQTLEEICIRKGIDPFEGLLELCMHEDAGIRLSALKEVNQYLHPKRRAIEQSIVAEVTAGEQTDQADRIVEEFKALLKQVAEERKD